MLRTLLLALILLLLNCFNCEHLSENYVRIIQPQKRFTYFNLPTSEEPVISWMDIKKGIYPNITSISNAINVGEPITIFIYLQDKSGLYDVMASDCFAYDHQDFAKSTHKIALSQKNNDNKKSNKSIEKWFQHNNPKGSQVKTFLYASLKSFKFPDNDQLYFMCHIELCFKKCRKENQ